MGLINSLTREAEDVARRAAVQEQSVKRRVTGFNKEIAGYNADASAKQAELEPLREIINHYNNVQVPEYNTNVKAYNEGYLTANGVNTFSQWKPGYQTDKEYWMPSNLAPGNPSGISQTVLAPANYTKTQVGAYGDGTPIYSFNAIANKPVAPDSSAATAADATLQSHKASIDDLTARSASLATKGTQLEKRNERAQTTADREVERLNTSVAHQKQALQAEQSPQQGSVFEQTTPFQSIFDWLKS